MRIIKKFLRVLGSYNFCIWVDYCLKVCKMATLSLFLDKLGLVQREPNLKMMIIIVLRLDSRSHRKFLYLRRLFLSGELS